MTLPKAETHPHTDSSPPFSPPPIQAVFEQVSTKGHRAKRPYYPVYLAVRILRVVLEEAEAVRMMLMMQVEDQKR